MTRFASFHFAGFLFFVILSFCTFQIEAVRKTKKSLHSNLADEIKGSVDVTIGNGESGDVFLKVGENATIDPTIAFFNYITCADPSDCTAHVYKAADEVQIDFGNCTKEFVKNRALSWETATTHNIINPEDQQTITIPKGFTEPYVVSAEKWFWAYGCRPDTEEGACVQFVYCGDGAATAETVTAETTGNVLLDKYQKAELAEALTGKYVKCEGETCSQVDFVGKMSEQVYNIIQGTAEGDAKSLWYLSCTPEFLADYNLTDLDVEVDGKVYATLGITSEDKAKILCLKGDVDGGSTTSTTTKKPGDDNSAYSKVPMYLLTASFCFFSMSQYF